MTAIDALFARCREERRAAFIPFLTAGDPSLDGTAELMQAMVDGGADLIELGVPFSDPVADGPVIQKSSQRALANGTTMSSILRLVARHRDRLGVPIVLFTYFNPVFVRGVANFAEQAASSGVDGVLCVDLPPEEGGARARSAPATPRGRFDLSTRTHQYSREDPSRRASVEWVRVLRLANGGDRRS